ncbi:Serine/threonine-protein phosphatase 4 regulatory subunit 3 [Gryllus bimaculatus]|nr:Serine/threonine-protein phosphatase 4 regulatory subunit 3 [Gryllus bimaculatus]
MANVPKRVKLYLLDNDQQWIDKGTGRIICTSCANLYSLKVHSELDDSILLDTDILPDISFEKQQETLILWCDKNENEFALSFQEKEACEAVWKVIRSVADEGESVEMGNILSVIEESDVQDDDSSSLLSDLPSVDTNNLKSINAMIRLFKTPSQKEKLSEAIIKANYVPKLLDIFCECENDSNFECLEYICEIFKHIVTLGNCSLFEEMFKKERILDVVGCFEYDKCGRTVKRHREFLSQKVQFKEVMPVLNPSLLDRIHQTYRIQYFQDVILPSINAVDESVFLSPFIYLNKITIVNLIQEDKIFLSNVFKLLSGKCTSAVKRKDVLLFLKELFSFAQNLQPAPREIFYQNLIELNIIHSLELSMQINSEDIKLCATEVINFIVEHSPFSVRKYMLEQANMISVSNPLIVILINGLTSETDSEHNSSIYLLFFKLLLNPENMESSLTKTDKTDFLNYFYKNAIDIIIEPILNISKDGLDKKCLAVVLELLEFCVEHHSYYIRNVILHKDLVRHVLKLMKSQYKVLALSALRFIKKIIALKNEFYNKYIIHGDLLRPVIEAFFENQGRYNMLDSAILDMFEFIRTEELKSLCSYVMEHFGEVLDNVQYVQTFKSLRHTYERNCLRNREKNIPIYLEDCFKSKDSLCCNTSEDESKNKLNSEKICDSVENFGIDMEIENTDSDTIKILSVDSPKSRNIVLDRTPIFGKFGRLRRSGVTVARNLCRKRLVDYGFDDDDEDEDNENGAQIEEQRQGKEETTELPFMKCIALEYSQRGQVKTKHIDLLRQDVAVLEGHTREVVSLHFSNSGQQILTGSFDGTIGIWDTRTAKREGLLVGHSEEISNCLYNFDCSLIASSSMDKTAKIWDPRTMSCLTTITGHQDEILDIAFDYKGQRLATASGDATAMVWDVHSNCNVVAVMQGHSEEVSKVCFSPAGNQLLTASLDQTARLWNAETGICSQVLSGHKDDVFSCCFSYSGHVIITASKDNTCRIWR